MINIYLLTILLLNQKYHIIIFYYQYCMHLTKLYAIILYFIYQYRSQ